MANVLSRVFSPVSLLYALVVITQFASGAYMGAQLQFPDGVTYLFSLGIVWAVGWWLRTDIRRPGVLAVYDLGFFLYLAWPAVMAYYLVKTRGAKGLLAILCFGGAYFGAAVLGVVVSVLVLLIRSA